MHYNWRQIQSCMQKKSFLASLRRRHRSSLFFVLQLLTGRKNASFSPGKVIVISYILLLCVCVFVCVCVCVYYFSQPVNLYVCISHHSTSFSLTWPSQPILPCLSVGLSHSSNCPLLIISILKASSLTHSHSQSVQFSSVQCCCLY